MGPEELAGLLTADLPSVEVDRLRTSPLGMMAGIVRSHVVTGAGRGVGRAIAERLLSDGDAVVVLEQDPDGVVWVAGHPAGPRVVAVTGSADDLATAERAADAAEDAGILSGWVNNAAIFRDATLHTDAPDHIVSLISANLAPVLVGSAVAVLRFRAKRTPGAIVNVSSHQAQRAVRGALPYATAKAAIEGLTRAAAVDYGPDGIRVNAVALGSITTDRYEALLDGQDPAVAGRTRSKMAEIHPLGRVGLPGRSRTPSPTCCPTVRVSSAAPSFRLTAHELLAARIPRRSSSARDEQRCDQDKDLSTAEQFQELS